MIAILDYGVGNLFSLSSSLAAIGVPCSVTSDARALAVASHILLPGVGAFGDAAAKLRATGLVPVLQAHVAAGKPLMGICLGMQLLFETGFEYGEHAGLGFLQGSVCAMEPDLRSAGFAYKVPHIGWNALDFVRPSPLLAYSKPGDYVYFVHSYYAKGCERALIATAEYGIAVPAVVGKNNVYGCQFHPEKSGEAGLAILKAFSALKTQF